MLALYDDVTKLFMTERNEHRKTTASFSVLVKEVREKAPIIAQQRREYEKVVADCINFL